MQQLAEANRAALAAITLVIFALLGYGYWNYMYKPAKATLATASAANAAAQQTLQQKQQALAQAQSANAGKQKSEAAATNKSYGLAMLALEAIPQNADLAEALSEISNGAKTAGVGVTQLQPQVSSADSGMDTTGTGAPPTASATQIEIDGYGDFLEIQAFTQALQETVTGVGSTAYVRGRMINIDSVEIDSPQADSDGGGGSASLGGGSDGGGAAIPVPAGKLTFKINVEVYSDTPAGVVAPDTSDADASSSSDGTDASGATDSSASSGDTTDSSGTPAPGTDGSSASTDSSGTTPTDTGAVPAATGSTS